MVRLQDKPIRAIQIHSELPSPYAAEFMQSESAAMSRHFQCSGAGKRFKPPLNCPGHVGSVFSFEVSFRTDEGRQSLVPKRNLQPCLQE